MKFDVVIIGGGLSGMRSGAVLQEAGLSTVAVAFGMSIHDTDIERYIKAGGTLLKGDRVLGGEFNGDALKCVSTENLSPVKLFADYFILSTGKYISGGLIADKTKIYEAVLGLETEYTENIEEWFNEDFYEKQPFMSFGVKTDSLSRVRKYNTTITNLFAAGEIKSGIDGSDLNSLENILSSAEEVARTILQLWKTR